MKRDIPALVRNSLGTDLLPDANGEYYRNGYEALGDGFNGRHSAHVAALRGIVRWHNDHSPDEKLSDWEPTQTDYAELRQQLRPAATRLVMINTVESYHLNGGHERDGHRLEEHQLAVFDDLGNFFLNGQRTPAGGLHGLIEMPTGSGKTVIFSKLVEAVSPIESRTKTLILVPKKDILHQTLGKDGQKGLGRFADGVRATSYYSDNKDLSGDTVVMTYQSFINLRKTGRLPDDFCDLVILDEAHHILGTETRAAIEPFIQDKVAIGLTATPEYASNKKVDEILINKIHTLDLREAIELGILSPVNCMVIKTDYKVDLDANKNRFSAKEYDRLASIEARNRVAVRMGRELMARGIKTLFSCLPGENLLHPQIISEMAEEEPVRDRITGERRFLKVVPLSGDMSVDERQAVYAQLERGEIDGLAYVDVIGEGWDSTAAKGLININPSCSPLYAKQRLGRVLRPGEDSTAYVVDILDDTAKNQYLGVHALGEYRYDPNKAYGRFNANHSGREILVDLPEDLKKAVTAASGKKVRELVVGMEYSPTHSELLPVHEVSKFLGIHVSALYQLTRYLSVELSEVVTDKGKKHTYIEDRHVEFIAAKIRTAKFRRLLQMTNKAQVDAFFEGIFADVPRDERLPKIKQIYQFREASDIDVDAEQTSTQRDEIDPMDTTGTTVTLSEPTTESHIQNLSLTRMRVLLLEMRGPQYDEARRVIMERIAGSRSLAVSLLNELVQQNTSNEISNTFESAGRGFECTVRLTYNGDTHTETAKANSKKEAQQLASLRVVQSLAGFAKEQDSEDLSYTEIERLRSYQIPVGKDNKMMLLNNTLSTMSIRPNYETQVVAEVGEFKVFETVLTFTLNGVLHKAVGRATSKRAAENRAAEEMMAGESAALLDGKKPKKSAQKIIAPPTPPVREAPNTPNLDKVTVGGKTFAIARDSVIIPYQWEQITGIKTTIDYKMEGAEIICTLTTSLPSGESIVLQSVPSKSKGDAKRNIGVQFRDRIRGLVLA